jgi:hypothetical protein
VSRGVAPQVARGVQLSYARRSSFDVRRPRAPIVIDPRTRDVAQALYIRRVERVNGQVYNSEFEKFAAVKDPGKYRLRSFACR